ncbi:MAG: hypothetical protein Q4G09_00785 [Clostridia bacterium]|nr:hypothetical protein [Clostridia bacterium]
MKKTIIIGLLAVVMCLALTGCGQEKTNNEGNEQTGTQQQEQQESQQQNNGISDSLGWPNNDFTKQVPKPEQTFTEEALSDSSSCYTYPNWTVAQAKLYVDKLENSGFTISSTYSDTDTEYYVVLKNADGSYQATVTSNPVDGGALVISIPLDRR